MPPSKTRPSGGAVEADIDEAGNAVTVSQIYSIYDPLGLLLPITIKYKLILQKLVSYGWDDELSGELLLTSQNVLMEMLMAREVTFPRGMIPEEADLSNMGLIGFCR